MYLFLIKDLYFIVNITTINEHLDFKFTSKVQSDSASRALSVIVTKMIKNGGFPYNIYSLLYDTCVTSISDYGAEIFGFQEYDSNLNLPKQILCWPGWERLGRLGVV